MVFVTYGEWAYTSLCTHGVTHRPYSTGSKVVILSSPTLHSYTNTHCGYVCINVALNHQHKDVFLYAVAIHDVVCNSSSSNWDKPVDPQSKAFQL